MVERTKAKEAVGRWCGGAELSLGRVASDVQRAMQFCPSARTYRRPDVAEKANSDSDRRLASDKEGSLRLEYLNVVS